MQYRIFIASIIILSISACSMMSLTNAGQMVQVVKNDPPATCQYLGETAAYTKRVTDDGPDLFNERGVYKENREKRIRNLAGEMGGNRVVWLLHISKIEMWFDHYAVYKC